MRKFLIYSIFIVASMVEVLMFVTSETYTQLTVAILIYPILFYSGWRLLLRKRKKLRVEEPFRVEQPVETTKQDSGGILDIGRRDFIRLIGAAGVSFFLYSIFSKRAEALFFGRSSDPGTTSLIDSKGKSVDPAERQPTDGYVISEIEDSDTPFYGFINKSGSWYIMKVDQDTGSFRYFRGELDFQGNWAKRKRLRYGYFHDVFSH